MLVNLIGNAIDAMAGQPGERRITITAARKGRGRVSLRIRDTGPGIAPQAAGQIFDPFFTTKGAGRGLGLGLSISYNIVRDFGGSLSLGRTGAEGTEFEIRLKEARRHGGEKTS